MIYLRLTYLRLTILPWADSPLLREDQEKSQRGEIQHDRPYANRKGNQNMGQERWIQAVLGRVDLNQLLGKAMLGPRRRKLGRRSS
jgi:hypothetical protein